ncbi:MAG: transcription-repair coupling factor [Bacilli bacterium]|nr:transcription-repair coupling factor [Bacilli bacterium]
MKLYEKLFKDDLIYDHLVGLNVELKALYIMNEFERSSDRSICVVTNSLYEANHLYQALQNYTSDVLLFPMDDFLTSEALAISPELKNIRLESLLTLSEKKHQIVITNLMGYLRYLPLPNIWNENSIHLKNHHDYAMEKLVRQLYQMGYEREVIVGKTGEMALRGYVVDIYPISSDHPVRIEFWGDTIDSIREIDVDSQLTIRSIDEVYIYPNSEFLVSSTFEVKEEINRDFHRELPQYTTVGNILDYMADPLVFYQNNTELKIAYEKLLDDMFQYSVSINLPGDTNYMNNFYEIHPQQIKYFSNFDEIIDETLQKKIYNTKVLEHFIGSIEQINVRLNQYLKEKQLVILALSDRYQVNKVIDKLENKQLLFTNIDQLYPDRINVVIQPMVSGFIIDQLIVITEKELYNQKSKTIQYKSKFKLGTKIRDITKLEPGDYIVHSNYGIGQYIGIKTLTKNGLPKDYIMLQYKGDDKLYLPVEKIDFISKYTSNGGSTPKLNKLGGTDWEKTKNRIQKKIEDIADDLLKLYAAREATPGFACLADNSDQIQFEKEFPYQETVDQLKVIDEIKKDMESSHPMDRLLCGDVGFGKTEVAFRAMFKMILSGKQVAFLCPTTILSKQHYENACERFKNFGVEIALLNRFITTKEANQLKKDLMRGKIDLLIGTHRILSQDIIFNNLGLLVIDEEQRFGVKHKEKIKQLRNNIDVLTLSATPIPRTLQLSLAGLRNLSLIETPPVNRYPVQTYVMAKNDTLLKDAIYKELSRDGQVFILYNRIEDMEHEASRIARLVPDASIITAHGQMNKQDLEDVMMKFVNHDYDVMICTTIIETGIDIPNVNTLIIQDADRFGLSQLYQIRGRVGRSDKIAYCYLMYDPRKILSEIAMKRLNVIKDFTELGSGFHIAMRDLSIRGAGDILGSEQAGFIDTVGIELFMQMLNDEIAKLKGDSVEKRGADETNQPLLDVATSIADEYVADEDLKIYIHKKINEIDSYDTLEKTKQELEDRFGKLNENLIIYMNEELFEKKATMLGIKEIRQTKNFINLVLPPTLTAQIDGESLFLKAMDLTRNIRFGMRGKCMVITLDTVHLDKHFIYYLIELMEILQQSIIHCDND